MIKLFWNTTSQDPVSGFQWGKYHLVNSNFWINYVLAKINLKKINSINEIVQGDTLIIIDCDIDKKIKFYEKLKILCSKFFLVNLGDEGGKKSILESYNLFDHIWRPYFNNHYKNNSKITFLPAGYKSGVEKNNELSYKRTIKWAFIGTAHKSSRHDLLYHFSKIKNGHVHKTDKFGDHKSMSIEEMNKILSSTYFIPCPNGFYHPETYRLYEALESGCVPIVERTYQYYDQVFPDNPFLMIDKWAEAKKMVEKFTEEEILEKQQECKKWWLKQKEKIQQSFLNIIK